MTKQAIFNLLSMFAIAASLFLFVIVIQSGKRIDSLVESNNDLVERMAKVEAIQGFVTTDSNQLQTALDFVLADQVDSIPNTPFERLVTARVNSMISWKEAMNHFVDELCEREGWDLNEVRQSVEARILAEKSNPKISPNE